MPELPEVESLRRSLIPFVQEKTITKIQITKPKLVSSRGTIRSVNEEKTKQFISQLTNETIQDVQRRAKNLIFIFKSGKIMLVHLKMTGQLVYQDSKKQISGGHPINNLQLPSKHTHLIFTLNEGTLYYNDIRQFGYLLFFADSDSLYSGNHFAHLGPEPLDANFSLTKFSQAMESKKTTLKSVLLDQKVVVGLGNIYADEVCFYAKVLPTRNCQTLTTSEKKLLFYGIQKILNKAISLGGSSIANYLLADGSQGNYVREHKVYGRGGKPCLICNHILKSIKLKGRTTVYCPQCQK